MAEQSISNSLLPIAPQASPRRQALRENLIAYLFLLPALLAIILVLFYPILNLLVTSFYSSPTLTHPSQFIGIKNYLTVLNDPIFPTRCSNTFIWTFGVTLGQVIWACTSR